MGLDDFAHQRQSQPGAAGACGGEGLEQRVAQFGRDAGGAYSRYQVVRDGSQWERDLWVKYVVQSGPAKNLSLRLMLASMRTGGDYGAIANDLDQTRIILDYPLDLGFLK